MTDAKKSVVAAKGRTCARTKIAWQADTYFAIILPGRAILRVLDRPVSGLLKTAVGFEVSIASRLSS